MRGGPVRSAMSDRPAQDGTPGTAWERVLAADRPALLDVHCHPEVPPIAPHATFEQTISTLESVLKGDPSAFHLVVEGLETTLQEALPGRRR